MSLHDPEVVRREYATEAGLAGRIAAYRHADGPDSRDVVFAAVAETRPGRLLEIGCGQGELAERMQRELGCAVVALDQSERMVELTRARGVETVLGDAQALPFADRSFDVVVAAWMLFHVPDVGRALDEIARVLRRGGRLVGATNARTHLRELYELLGLEREATTFDAEDAAALLEQRFATVRLEAVGGAVRFPDREAVQSYVDASMLLLRGGTLPVFDGPLRVTRAMMVFVAETAA